MENESWTKYSIVVPIYGTPDLHPLLYSLVRQSIPKEQFEIILVDDATPLHKRIDYSEYAKKYTNLTIRLVQLRKNMGPAAARNAGIVAAHGEVVFFTDDDCVVPADWMERHIVLYNRHPHVSAIGGWYTNTQSDIVDNVYQHIVHASYSMLTGTPGYFELYSDIAIADDVPFISTFPGANTANLSVKTIALNMVRGFDERYTDAGFEDFDLMNRLRGQGFVLLYVPHFVLHRKQFNGFRSFLRYSKNRAFGVYVSKRIKKQQFPNWFQLYLVLIDTFQRISVYTNGSWFYRLKIKALALLYYWYAFSPFSQVLIGIKWRRKMKKREQA